MQKFSQAQQFTIEKASPALANAQTNWLLFFDMLGLGALSILPPSHLCLYLRLFPLDQLGLEMFNRSFCLFVAQNYLS